MPPSAGRFAIHLEPCKTRGLNLVLGTQFGRLPVCSDEGQIVSDKSINCQTATCQTAAPGSGTFLTQTDGCSYTFIKDAASEHAHCEPVQVLQELSCGACAAAGAAHPVAFEQLFFNVGAASLLRASADQVRLACG